MGCDRFKVLLSAYIDGEVVESERIEVESHLATCQSCSVELDKLCQLKNLFGRLEVKEPATGFRSRLSAKLATAPQSVPFWYRLKVWTLENFPQSLTAAILFLLLMIGTSFIFLESQPTKLLINVSKVQSSQLGELYAEDILFESALGSMEGEDVLSFNVDTTPFEELFEGLDLGG